MGTRADFYVGRGEQAEWLGSIGWEGYPDGIPVRPFSQTVSKATDERRIEVKGTQGAAAAVIVSPKAVMSSREHESDLSDGCRVGTKEAGDLA